MMSRYNYETEYYNEYDILQYFDNLLYFQEVKVTASFLGQSEDQRGCQNDENFHSCTTRRYLKRLEDKCGCLPFNIRTPEVRFYVKVESLIL